MKCGHETEMLTIFYLVNYGVLSLFFFFVEEFLSLSCYFDNTPRRPFTLGKFITIVCLFFLLLVCLGFFFFRFVIRTAVRQR